MWFATVGTCRRWQSAPTASSWYVASVAEVTEVCLTGGGEGGLGGVSLRKY